MVREDKPGVRQLVAYVVPQPGARVQSGELLQHLKNSLPEFMVPGVVMILEKFPLSPSGKIDRHALPQPELMHGQKGQEGSGPRDEIERALFEIWKEVLGINSCTVTDNFFELG